ncbi:flagellar basal body-associated protein FliL [Novosphingobium sp. Rr 2-17]|uniref:flagellar basal body-associated FliL family protein n=1 Tax=Novosphingobium sp. Rr 2-17 TaxID=555793 RepID=UPI0002699546|nr:flagellar basal body-associated FliL family protein [Novosphingobium sp. Rr 2-17]EIZ78737.1 flagellar basal body-associated protein FliL [Novosphingobium sp. Rr 2-17]
MSEPEPESEIVEGSETPPAQKAPRFSKRVLIIVGGVVALLLIISGAAFFLLRPAGGEAEPAAEAKSEGHDEEEATYIDAPAMVVNLRAADGTARFLKIRFTFVPVSAAKGELIKAKLPLIVDAFQPFLRELRPEDLAGSAAVFRIKEEMLVRATGAMGPDVVKDILIQDLIQQ